MKMCNYQVGDLLILERSKGKLEIWIVITELSGCTIRVKNVATGKIHRMPPRWFTKI